MFKSIKKSIFISFMATIALEAQTGKTDLDNKEIWNYTDQSIQKYKNDTPKVLKSQDLIQKEDEEQQATSNKQQATSNKQQATRF